MEDKKSNTFKELEVALTYLGEKFSESSVRIADYYRQIQDINERNLRYMEQSMMIPSDIIDAPSNPYDGWFYSDPYDGWFYYTTNKINNRMQIPTHNSGAYYKKYEEIIYDLCLREIFYESKKLPNCSYIVKRICFQSVIGSIGLNFVITIEFKIGVGEENANPKCYHKHIDRAFIILQDDIKYLKCGHPESRELAKGIIQERIINVLSKVDDIETQLWLDSCKYLCAPKDVIKELSVKLDIRKE